MTSRRRTWFLVRLVIYVAVIAALFVARGGGGRLRRLLDARAGSDSTLTVAGRDLAPPLVDRLLADYRADYPHLTVTVRRGSTNQALEDLFNGLADVAFLYRRPTADEQAQVRAVDGDTAVVVPVAIGGGVLLAAAGAGPAAATLADVRAAGAGELARGPWRRLYAPDPNDGLWEALRPRLGAPAGIDTAGLVFLSDGAAVARAVAADTLALGLATTFTAAPAPGVRVVPLAVAAGDSAAGPTNSNLVTGAYPLYHFLYAACRDRASIEGVKLVTHLASARGQRQVVRAGATPARQVAREVILTRDPPGTPRGTR